MTDQENKPEAPLIAPRPEQEAQAPEKTVTERQQQSIPDGMKWLFEFSAPTAWLIMLHLNAEQDYKQGRWHYIPLSINESARADHQGHKVLFQILCIDDKQAQKRLEKKLKKWANKPIEWIDVTQEIKPQNHE